ncbi:Uncharacterised protein [uncultured archaeon]|nr:Uncharacterised protein [uncultured archaeon]
MEMASWFEDKKGQGYIFLTDEDIIAHHGGDKNGINWNDFVGHHGLMQVFHLPDAYNHYEGFVRMPDVIRKTILAGKMDMMFAHADNLCEATPEFIPMMHRLSSRYSKVASALSSSPYRDWHIEKGKPTLHMQMKVGIENGFKGSTIGEILRHPLCDEKTMFLALEGARELMDEYPEHHHYRNMVENQYVTKKVLNFILKNIPHVDVKEWAEARLKTCKDLKLTKVTLTRKKVKTVQIDKALVRSL